VACAAPSPEPSPGAPSAGVDGRRRAVEASRPDQRSFGRATGAASKRSGRAQPPTTPKSAHRNRRLVSSASSSVGGGWRSAPVGGSSSAARRRGGVECGGA
jgi:hypothetical protein